MDLQFKKLKIVAAAIAFSTLMLVFVNFIVSLQIMGGPDLFSFYILSGNEPLVMVLTLLAVFLAGFSFMAPKVFKGPSKSVTVYSASVSSLFYNWNQFQPHMFTTTVIRLALAESIAIFGFVLAFLNHAFLNMLPFVFVSLVVQFCVGPFNRKGCE